MRPVFWSTIGFIVVAGLLILAAHYIFTNPLKQLDNGE